MRELVHLLHNHLAVGLRRDSRTRRGQPALTYCRGLQTFNDVLVAQQQIEAPQAFPPKKGVYPILLPGETRAMYALDSRNLQLFLHKVNPATFTLTEIAAFSDAQQDVYKTWSHVNSQGHLFASNGNVCVIAVDDGAQLLREEEDVLIPASVSRLGNRVMLAGINNYSLSTPWFNEMVDEWKQRVPPPVVVHENVTAEQAEQFIILGSSAGSDMMHPYWMERKILAGPDNDDQMDVIMSSIRQGVIDLAYIPTAGKIVAAHAVGQSIVVLCTSDAWIITPGETGLGPPVQLTNFGISTQGASIMLGNSLYFISTDGRLFNINRENAFGLLGFKEYLSRLQADRIVMATDPSKGDIWIHDNKEGFVLRSDALAHCELMPSWTYRDVEGQLLGNENKLLEDFEFETHEFDLGIRAIKQLQSVELGMEDAGRTTVLIKSRFDRDEVYYTSEEFQVNQEGVATPQFCGADFRVVVRGELYPETVVDRMSVRWKAGDRRFIRGTTENVSAVEDI